MEAMAKGDLTGLNGGLDLAQGKVGSDGRRSVLNSGRWRRDTDRLFLRCASQLVLGGSFLLYENLLASLEKVARRGDMLGPNEAVGEVGAKSVSVEPDAISVEVGIST